MLFIAIGLSFHYFLVRDLGLENSDITIVTILYPQSKVLSFWQLLTNEYRQLFSSFLNFKLMSMASRYCQKSSSFLNVSKIPQYISRYSYNWSSFPYRVFSFDSHLSYRDAHTIGPVFHTRYKENIRIYKILSPCYSLLVHIFKKNFIESIVLF